MNIMKHLCAVLALILLPLGTTAQEHIEKAFADFLKMKGNTYSESHSKDSDPETLQKKGLLDIYSFEVNNWKPSMLDNIRKAFRQDSENAYQENWATRATMEGAIQRKIMYNDRDGIYIGQYPNYILLCFIDKEQKDYRYAYVVEWNDKDGKGRLIKTYAPLPQKTKTKTFILPELPGNIPGSIDTLDLSSTSKNLHWLTEFDIYKKRIQDQPKGVAATFFATKIYDLCKRCDVLNETERYMVAEQINKLTPLTKDDMISTLFTSSIKMLTEK